MPFNSYLISRLEKLISCANILLILYIVLQAQKLVDVIMPINKISQLVATVIDYPYLDVDYAVIKPVPLIIDSAIYYDPSAPDNSLDVEPFLTPLIFNNQISFIVENATFGGNRTDPARGKVKELKITYSYNGIRSTMICKEKATVALQCF